MGSNRSETGNIALGASQGELSAGTNGRGAFDGVAVSVVVPALNEARNLPLVLPGVPEGVDEIILVDGGSTDETVETARAVCPSIKIVRQTGKGKGDALALGFREARGDIIVMIDADGSTDPLEITRFVEALLHGADYAKGSRYLPGGGSEDITSMRSAGNRVLTRLVNMLYGTQYSDLCYGYNAFWRRCLPYVTLDASGFEIETVMNLRVAKAGLRVVEVPSFERARIHGTSNLRTFRDGWRVLRRIFRERAWGRRRKLDEDLQDRLHEVTRDPEQEQEHYA